MLQLYVVVSRVDYETACGCAAEDKMNSGEMAEEIAGRIEKMNELDLNGENMKVSWEWGNTLLVWTNDGKCFSVTVEDQPEDDEL